MELPIGYVEGMRVPGRVFASGDLLHKAVEDRAIEQVANVATLPGIVGYSLAMPDIHWGYGFPIGGVAATDVDAGGVVSPGGVGFDIGCGVRLIRSELDYAAEVKPSIRELVDTLGRRVPRGVGGKGRMKLDASDLEKVLLEGVKFPVSRARAGMRTRSSPRTRERSRIPSQRTSRSAPRSAARRSSGAWGPATTSSKCRSSIRSAITKLRRCWAYSRDRYA